jgi:hypothetical protein
MTCILKWLSCGCVYFMNTVFINLPGDFLLKIEAHNFSTLIIIFSFGCIFFFTIFSCIHGPKYPVPDGSTNAKAQVLIFIMV